MGGPCARHTPRTWWHLRVPVFIAPGEGVQLDDDHPPILLGYEAHLHYTALREAGPGTQPGANMPEATLEAESRRQRAQRPEGTRAQRAEKLSASTKTKAKRKRKGWKGSKARKRGKRK